MIDNMDAHVVIPARMASTRLPEKPLADIAGIPMIVRVARQVCLAKIDSVVVAVDEQRVFDVVEAAGYKVLMTRADHLSGSDRVLEVANTMGWPSSDVVINVQGDEPLMPAVVINELVSLMRTDMSIDLATLSEPISSFADFVNPNIVKVVTDRQSSALYFSRSAIPYPRDEMAQPNLSDQQMLDIAPQRHVGVYAFRVAALREFVTLADSRLEQVERLEQLRWLEAGRKIHVMQSSEPIPGGIDTPEDLERVIEILKKSQ